CRRGPLPICCRGCLVQAGGRRAGGLGGGEGGGGGGGELRGELLGAEALLDQLDGGEGPLGHVDRPALVVLERVLDEVLAHRGDHLVEGQRVRGAGDHLVVGVVPAAGDLLGGQRDDHVDHVVDGDHVEDRIGQTRELGQGAAGVRHDQRVRDLVAVDPAGERLGHGRLDDRGAHEGDAVAV